MSGGAAAGLVRSDTCTNGARPWSGPCDRGSTPSCLPQARVGVATRRSQLGRATALPAHPGGSTRVLEPLGGTRRHRQPGGGVPDSSGPGATAWPAGQTVGGVPVAGPSWLANGRAGHMPPQEQTRGAGGLEKKLPAVLDTLLTRDAVTGRHVRLMFHDEARGGRRVRIRRGWAPSPPRPVVARGTCGSFSMSMERSARWKVSWTG